MGYCLLTALNIELIKVEMYTKHNKLIFSKNAK